MKHLILATAGHVDHGKTALIKALTGTDTDRLPEEKARGITIDLGFAHLSLGDVSLGIVDVPGHEDFVKNMVAGVGAIDLALLVVAADDGWMPQTEEHLQILEYLGVTRAAVAVTKSDLTAPPNESIRARLADSLFHNAPIVPLSAKTGEGLDQLRRTLAALCLQIPPPRDRGKPRLAVDRAFTLRGIGAVVTGTLTGGKLRRGEAIVIQPASTPARIRAMQTHNREIEQCEPGMRTALNLPGTEVRRGDLIALAEMGPPSPVIDVVVRRSARLLPNTRRLKSGRVVRVHHGSANTVAQIFFSNDDSLGAGACALARLRFAKPVFAFYGDRFVLRDSSGRSTLAGALVLDTAASAKSFRTFAQQQMLAARAAAPNEREVFIETQLRRDRVIRPAAILRQSNFDADDSWPGFLVEPNWWREVCERAAALIDAEHLAHPNRVGLELARLRDAAALPDDEVFQKLIADLCANGFKRNGEAIQRTTHRPSLPANLQSAGERIRAALAAKPFDPPSRKELATDSASQEALRFLRETNELVEISSEVVVNRDALEQMRAKIRQTLGTNGGATVSELRQALGSSRRVVVPVLEYFDRAGLTRRLGDKRVLAAAR